MTFQNITTVAQLEAMDSELMVKGYRAGYANQPDYNQREQAYWHGYLNGQVDGKHMQISDDQRKLAQAYVARWKMS